MARSGQFGRLPRQAPDLSGAIAALLREAQNQYDSNMVDAWKNGGEVEGKGVSDSRLLEHMRTRMKGLAKDDPLYDEWQNRYTQYDFAIEESKMALKNDQGKISDGEMANFYRKWAAKPEVQKNSEFYRSLLSRAAKWQAAAKARSSASNAAAEADAHNKWVGNFYKNHVAGAETATGYLLYIAKTYGAAPPNANSLDDIDTNSAAYGKFLDVIDDGKAADPNIQGVIDEMKTAIQKTNPNWTWSESNLNDLLARGDTGMKRLGQESTTPTERKNWADRRENLRYEQTRIRQTEANERIQVAADTFALDLDHCAGDSYCEGNAVKKLRDKLQAEVPNVVAGKGVTSAKTQDVKVASSLISTIGQLDDIIAGRDVQTPAARAGQAGEGGAPAPGFTVFDAAGGRDSPTGWLANVGNQINADKTKLDNGGWVMSEPMMSGQVPILDGNGKPMYTVRTFDKNTPPPDGFVGIVGNTSMRDETRSLEDEKGFHHVTKTPTMYVGPSEPAISFVGPDGVTVDPSAGGGVKHYNGETEVAPPWTELRNVPGPDGVPRTLYRTGNGVDTPYLFHDQPPVPPGTPRNAAGQVIIQVTPKQDPEGRPYWRGESADIVNGVVAQRSTVRPAGPDDRDPPFVLGTYRSTGATTTAQAVANAFAGKSPTASQDADKWVAQFQRSALATPTGSAEQLSMMSDFRQLSQAVSLYKQGKAGSMLNDAYTQMNTPPPKEQGYLDQLNRAGFAKYGPDELNRRADLLAGIDDAEKRLGSRFPTGVVPMGGSRAEQYQRGFGPTKTFEQQKSDLEAQKRNVFNPSISVSNINVPGMPAMFMPPGEEKIGGYSRAAWEAILQPGVLPGAKPQAYPAPAAGPTYTPPAVAPPKAPEPDKVPTAKTPGVVIPTAKTPRATQPDSGGSGTYTQTVIR